MRRAPRTLLAALLAGLAFAGPGCQSEGGSWVPPEDHLVTVLSDPVFVRTRQGDYLDGYLAVYEDRFERRRMFMALEIVRFAKGDRLDVTVRPTKDFVRIGAEGEAAAEVPVFVVERAKPSVPEAPKMPSAPNVLKK
ncbi:MAG TPA: hypothetical protein VLJ16_06000 [Acidobacteriota bacterium]|nr:hypothetical protein [Acidobacteriota bacterium]